MPTITPTERQPEKAEPDHIREERKWLLANRVELGDDSDLVDYLAFIGWRLCYSTVTRWDFDPTDPDKDHRFGEGLDRNGEIPRILNADAGAFIRRFKGLWKLPGAELWKLLRDSLRDKTVKLPDHIVADLANHTKLVANWMRKRGLMQVELLTASGKTPVARPTDLPLDDEDVAVMLALDEAYPLLLSITQTAENTKLSETTVKKRLPRLITEKLVYRPKGKRQGATLTEQGHELIDRAAPSKKNR